MAGQVFGHQDVARMHLPLGAVCGFVLRSAKKMHDVLAARRRVVVGKRWRLAVVELDISFAQPSDDTL
jgi:hypothetical protein